jgi:hypothetical protein
MTDITWSSDTNWQNASKTDVTVENGSFQLASAIPDSGVVRYTFDKADTNVSTAIDMWNGNDGTINGATTGISGSNQTYTTNEAYDFDGIDDNVDTSISDIATATLTAWVNLDSADSNNREIISTRNSDSGGGLRYGDSNDNRWALYTRNGGSWTAVAGSIASTNTWVHLAGVIDDNNQLILYENGSKVASAGIGSRNLGNQYRVGERPDGSDIFDGSIDDVRIYDKALSETEISNLYNTGEIY